MSLSRYRYLPATVLQSLTAVMVLAAVAVEVCFRALVAISNVLLFSTDSATNLLLNCVASATQAIDEAIRLGMQMLTSAVYIAFVQLGGLVAIFGLLASGVSMPALVTVLAILAMIILRKLSPSAADYVDQVLGAPLGVGGVAYAIMASRKKR